MLVSDFRFDLPDELIAQEAAPRGASRLLVIDRATGARHHDSIAALASFLRAGDLLVVNNTRVFAARLLGHRDPSGGAVECLLLGPAQPDPDPWAPWPAGTAHPGTQAPWHSGTPGLYDALVHPGQKLKPGARLRFAGPAGALAGEVVARHFHGRRTIRLWAESGDDAGALDVKAPDDLDALIDAIGHMPLPPYIKRPDTRADRERYQTVFARVRGSVAAPTAGLHFTPELLSSLDVRGVERTEITLHVGYGTFKPVRVDRVEDHVVDSERYEILPAAADAMNRARADGRRVIAVGTTTTRALEDAAARGAGLIPAGRGAASLFIYPGHPFRAIDGLITNFHLPASSLLMLVAAFGGRDQVLAAYRDAVLHRYRFYSYGDAMLVL